MCDNKEQKEFQKLFGISMDISIDINEERNKIIQNAQNAEKTILPSLFGHLSKIIKNVNSNCINVALDLSDEIINKFLEFLKTVLIDTETILKIVYFCDTAFIAYNSIMEGEAQVGGVDSDTDKRNTITKEINRYLSMIVDTIVTLHQLIESMTSGFTRNKKDIIDSSFETNIEIITANLSILPISTQIESMFCKMKTYIVCVLNVIKTNKKYCAELHGKRLRSG